MLRHICCIHIYLLTVAEYMIGGAEPSEELWMYSTVNATWELLETRAGEDKPKARISAAMTAVGNNILIHASQTNSISKSLHHQTKPFPYMS